MQIIFAFFILISLLFCLSGCDVNQNVYYGNGDETFYESEEESYDANSEVDLEGAAEFYKFLLSPYTATAKNSAMSTQYEYEYYFIDGVVAGMRAKVAFPDEKQAYAYYEIMSEQDPFIAMTDTTVIYFSSSEDLYFDKYTPEQLCFALGKAGYDVVLNFDLDQFNELFGEDTSE